MQLTAKTMFAIITVKGGDYMNKAELEKCVEEFRTETLNMFKEGSQEPATIGDLSELARSTYYVFSEILKTLE